MNARMHATDSPELNRQEPHILIVDDVDTRADHTLATLRQVWPNGVFERSADLADCRARLAEGQTDLVLAWWSLATQGEPDLLSHARQRFPDLPILFLVPPSHTHQMSQFLGRGLTDYVATDRLERLGFAVKRSLDEAERSGQLRAQAEGQGQEQRHQGLFENHHTIMLIIDPADGQIVDANPAAENYYGWSRAQLRQMQIHQINTLTPAEVRAEIARAASQQRTHFHFKHRRAYGDVRDVEVFSGPVHLGERALLYSIIHDVTDRMAVEAALQESEARFRRLAENAPDIIYRYQLKPEPGFDYVSPAATAITGYTPQEHYSDPVLGFKLIHPDDRPLMESLTEGLAANTPIILRWIRRDGEVIWVEQINVPVYDEAGDLVALEGISRDITERKQAEERLALQRIAMESAANAIVITDQNGTVEWVNPAYTRLTGYAAEDVIGGNPRILKSGRQPLPFYADLWETILAGEVWHGELINRRKDGSLYVEEQTITPLRDAQGKISHFVAIKQDITERKQREQELEMIAQVTAVLRQEVAQSELLPTLLARLQELTGAHGVGLFIADEAGYAEPVPARRRGEPKQPRSVTVGTITLAEDGLPAGVHWGGQAIAHQQVIQRQIPGRGQAGEAAPVALAALPAGNGKESSGALWLERPGDPFTPEELSLLTPVVEIAFNTWQRVHLFERIRAQAEENTQIMRSVPDGLLLLDGEYRVAQANPAAQKYLALLADSGLGDVLTHLGGRPLFELLTSPPLGSWHRIAHRKRLFEIIARPLTFGDTGWVVVLRDATQAQMVQDQLERQQRLAAIGQMAAGIAHDFNNLMGVIVLYAGVMDKSAELSPKDRERLTLIRQQARYATEMIQQILDFSRSSVMEFTPMDLLPLLKEQVKLLQRTLPENIELSIHAQDGEYLIKADPTRIQQVLMNLAINARDAMPEGGQLRFDLVALTLDRQRDLPLPDMAPGSWLRLTVSDTGPGIPAEVQDRLFEPFVSTKGAGQGTGLGLAQVHGIIAQHDGQIILDSTSSAGTTFVIYLPALNLSHSPAATPGSQDLPMGQGERILVVEDNDTLRSALVDYLRMWQYTTMELADGSQVLDYLGQTSEPPDLILSDVVMPKMGGLALLHKLHAEGYRIPVLLLTGHSLQETDVADLRTLGMVGWLSKPPDLQRLARQIAQTLGHL